MRVVGMLTTVVGVVVVAIGGVIGVRSIPDIKRYLKMRKM